MANPRQRRKQKSGTAKVKLSTKSRKNKNKVVLKAPFILQQSWDKHKTVRQNYALLGLLPKLNPRQAGGIEPVEHIPYAILKATPATLSDLDSNSGSDSDEEEDEEEEIIASTSTASTTEPRKLAKGEGRIIRDETGKIFKIVYGGDDGYEISEDVVERAPKVEGEDDSDDEEEEEDEEEEVVKEPWGPAMTEWAGENPDEELLEEEAVDQTRPRSVGQGIPIHAPRRKIVAKTQVVRELELLSTRQTKVIRHSSTIELDWLTSLVEKYDDNFSRMTMDKKLNPWQKTTGEIKRMIVKAGGIQKLKEKAKEVDVEMRD